MGKIYIKEEPQGTFTSDVKISKDEWLEILKDEDGIQWCDKHHTYHVLLYNRLMHY